MNSNHWTLSLLASTALLCGCTARTEAEEKAQPAPTTLPEPQREEAPATEPPPAPPVEEPQPPVEEPVEPPVEEPQPPKEG